LNKEGYQVKKKLLNVKTY